MKAASDILKCKFILFTLDNDKFDTQVIDDCGGTQLEAPLFIAASLEETNQFQSAVFKQDENEYRQRFLPDYTGLLVHDNLGRLHLLTSYNGPVHLSLRANNFHLSTIATHVSDLYKIYSSSQFTSVMSLADGGPDYSSANILSTSCFTSDYSKPLTLIFYPFLRMLPDTQLSTPLSMFGLH